MTTYLQVVVNLLWYITVTTCCLAVVISYLNYLNVVVNLLWVCYGDHLFAYCSDLLPACCREPLVGML